VHRSTEYRLIRHHRADFTSIKHIDEQGFDHVVLVMGQCNLIAADFTCNFENPLSPESGTEKTGFFLL
jgi:hypothetical protein